MKTQRFVGATEPIKLKVTASGSGIVASSQQREKRRLGSGATRTHVFEVSDHR
jgi:hypothetical protein